MNNIIRVTIKSLAPPKGNSKSGTIVGTKGELIGAFPDKLKEFTTERTYDIAYSEKEWNGKVYKNLVSATAVEASRPGATSTAAPSASNGRPEGLPGGELKDEQIFVCALLKEAIRGGLVPIDKDALTTAIKHIRAGYRGGFGSNTFTASEAGHFTSGAARVARG